MTFLGNKMTMTSLIWRNYWFFKILFCHDQLEKTKFGHIT